MPFLTFFTVFCLCAFPGVVLVWSKADWLRAAVLPLTRKLNRRSRLTCYPCCGFWCAWPGAIASAIVLGDACWLVMPLGVFLMHWAMLPAEAKSWRAASPPKPTTRKPASASPCGGRCGK